MTQPTRRRFLQSATTAAIAATLISRRAGAIFLLPGQLPLREVGYDQVTVTSPLHVAQIENTRSILLGFSDDSLMKPFRMMAGQPAPGEEIGGWYQYLADYNYRTGDAGLSPGASYGQWTSALARMSVALSAPRDQRADSATYAPGTDPALAATMRERVLRLNQLWAPTIVPAYYTLTRLPAYSLDKFVGGLADSHRLLSDPNAFAILDRSADAAVLALPGRPVDRDVPWLKDRDISWNWDESPTLPENLYLAYALGAGQRYRAMAEQYLDNKTFFDPLARGENVLGHRHGYSYVNAMGSAMQAWMVTDSERHLRAAINGFNMLEAQSYATGGWAPDETLVAPDSDKVYESLTSTHNNFESPCCSYAHFKLTRYLLRVTREGRYGDSMERVMYNTVLGALPLESDGHTYYFQDYNYHAKRIYSVHRWPCCSGTLPQVAADYGINSYFQEPGVIWVNLYIPSVLRWSEGDLLSASSHLPSNLPGKSVSGSLRKSTGPQLALTQHHDYSYTGDIRLSLSASAPANFILRLRIPAWAAPNGDLGSGGNGTGVLLRVNNQPWPVHIQAGFTSIARTWSHGDVVELTLPMRLRLEPIPGSTQKTHPKTAALLRGPLVLFPLGDGPHKFHARDLLAASQTGGRAWTVPGREARVELVPFTEVGDSPYSTYVALA